MGDASDDRRPEGYENRTLGPGRVFDARKSAAESRAALVGRMGRRAAKGLPPDPADARGLAIVDGILRKGREARDAK
jgi:hypothetical protein